MTYKGPSDGKLPKYVKNRSFAIRRKWVNLFNKASEQFGEKRAILIANKWLKKQVKARPFIKRSTLKFDVYTKNGFISRSTNGDDYITLVLNTINAHRDGVKYTEKMLIEMAEQINKEPIVGDVDHILYNKILNSSMTDEQVKRVLKSKLGIAKTVKAIYKKGKLWIRVIIDKRYKKLIEKSKGVSSEIFYTEHEGKTFNAGEMLGFTFNVNTTPAEYKVGVVA